MKKALARWNALSAEDRARIVGEKGGVPAAPTGPRAAVRPDGRSEASHTQQQQWFLDRLGAGAAAYIVPFALRLSAEPDTDALRAALAGVARRHDVLRSRFESVDGVVQQVVGVDVPALEQEDVDPGEDPSAALHRRATEIASEPFDLARGPLLRTVLLRARGTGPVLVWVAHHAVADGASVGVLLDELASGYAAALGEGPEPAAPAVQYADLADWQRTRLTASRRESLTGFWADHLGDAGPMGVPAVGTRPALPSFRGDAVGFRLPEHTATGVAELAERCATTEFSVLLTALHLTLAKFCGQLDGVLGVAVAGRDRAEAQQLVGPFAGTVPVRIDATGDPGVEQLVRRVADTVLDALDHQEMPFGELVRSLGRGREAGHNPVYDVLFTMDALDGAAHRELAPGLSVEASGVPNGTARLDLQLTVERTRDGLGGRLDFSLDLFDAATASAVVTVFAGVLDGMAAAGPAETAPALPSCSPAVAERILDEALAPLSGPVEAEPVLDAFAARVRADPNRVAVVDGRGRLTYAELDHWADRIAAALHARGAGPGTVVGVALDRSTAMPAALLGVFRAGATYLPLEPAYPADRTRFMLSDSGAAVVLHRDRLVPAPPGVAAVDIDDLGAAGGADGSAVRSRPDPAGRAYVMYTSGSTGNPKGVAVDHPALANFLAAMAGHGLVRRDDVIVAPTNLTFDISLDEILLPLVVGATVVVADRARARSGAALRDLVESSGATVLHGTPSTYRLLVDAGWTGARVRRVLCGGEALDAGLAAELHERTGEVWNLYGPTEATVWSLVHRVEPGAEPPLGAPLANTGALVLDEHRRPVPPGVVGELYLAGAGLAAGYLNRPELTADRFVTGPRDVRMYRTGDLAARGPDGLFRFHGRTDHQVKVRGHRIELGEIDAALLRVPDVREAVTLLHRHDAGDARLVAYVRTAGADERALRTALEAALPAAMVPSRFVEVAAFPLNNSGKVDRAALADTPLAEPAVPAGAVLPDPPAGDTERWIAGTWAELLGRSGVARSDNFFACGGHSLLVVKMLAGVEEHFGTAPSLEDFFAVPTVSGLAEAVDRAVAAAPVPDVDDDLLRRIEELSDDEVADLMRRSA